MTTLKNINNKKRFDDTQNRQNTQLGYEDYLEIKKNTYDIIGQIIYKYKINLKLVSPVTTMYIKDNYSNQDKVLAFSNEQVDEILEGNFQLDLYIDNAIKQYKIVNDISKLVNQINTEFKNLSGVPTDDKLRYLNNNKGINLHYRNLKNSYRMAMSCMSKLRNKSSYINRSYNNFSKKYKYKKIW